MANVAQAVHLVNSINLLQKTCVWASTIQPQSQKWTAKPEYVSVPEPRGTAVGAQNKRDRVVAACSTELSTTWYFYVVHAAARLLYIPDGHVPSKVTADVKAVGMGLHFI